jgi:hypothetical protein
MHGPSCDLRPSDSCYQSSVILDKLLGQSLKTPRRSPGSTATNASRTWPRQFRLPSSRAPIVRKLLACAPSTDESTSSAIAHVSIRRARASLVAALRACITALDDTAREAITGRCNARRRGRLQSPLLSLDRRHGAGPRVASPSSRWVTSARFWLGRPSAAPNSARAPGGGPKLRQFAASLRPADGRFRTTRNPHRRP